MKHSQITDERIKALSLDHAKKLVGNLGSFIEVVKGKIKDPIWYDKKTLFDIFNILVVMEIEAIGYRNGLQEKKFVTFPAVLKAESKRLTLKMDNIPKNESTDTLSIFQHYTTTHTVVKALEL